MQLLIDTATETPKSLLVASRILSLLSAELFILQAGPQPSINGDGHEVVLTTTDKVGDVSHTESVRVAPINATFSMPGAAPDAPAPEAFNLDTELAKRDQMDPKVVFGRFGASVPAGTNVDPSLPASCAAPDAPAAPAMNAGAAAAVGTLTAPPAPTTPAVNTVVSADRDTKGIPWDARVHSDTRKTNADGTWRFRRNLDEATKNAVMTELRGAVKVPPVQLPAVGGSPGPNAVAGQLPLPPEAPPVPGLHVSSNTLPTAPDAPNAPVTLPGTLPLPASANVGVPDAPNPPVVSAPITGFRDLMSKINIARSQGRLTQEQVDAACKAANVGSITELAAQPALVPSVNAQLDRYLGVAA